MHHFNSAPRIRCASLYRQGSPIRVEVTKGFAQALATSIHIQPVHVHRMEHPGTCGDQEIVKHCECYPSKDPNGPILNMM